MSLAHSRRQVAALSASRADGFGARVAALVAAVRGRLVSREVAKPTTLATSYARPACTRNVAVRVAVIAARRACALTTAPEGTRSRPTSATVVLVPLVRTLTSASRAAALTVTGRRAPGVSPLPAPIRSRTVRRPDQ